MVKVLRSFVRGPLEPHIVGLAEELLRQGYTQASAEPSSMCSSRIWIAGWAPRAHSAGAADAIDDYLAQQTLRLARTHGTGSGPEVGQRDLRTAIVAAGAIQIRDDRGPQSVG